VTFERIVLGDSGSARHVYVKLGVGNRTAALASARGLGTRESEH
jgi:hypothetical protein